MDKIKLKLALKLKKTDARLAFLDRCVNNARRGDMPKDVIQTYYRMLYGSFNILLYGQYTVWINNVLGTSSKGAIFLSYVVLF